MRKRRGRRQGSSKGDFGQSSNHQKEPARKHPHAAQHTTDTRPMKEERRKKKEERRTTEDRALTCWCDAMERGSLRKTRWCWLACLAEDTRLVCWNHVLDVDKGVIASRFFKRLQCLLDQIANVQPLLLPIVDCISHVCCSQGQQRVARQVWRELRAC